MRKQCKSITCCGIALLAALLFLFYSSPAVFAADVAGLELGRTGSVELTLADGSGNVVFGGEISIYQVASLYLQDGNMAYTYTEEFQGCTADLDVTDSSLAQNLAQFAADNDIRGTAVSVGSDGVVSFDDLELGLYLLVQTASSDQYEDISPFVVTVPIENDGQWEYEVNASPKVGIVSSSISEEYSEPEASTEPEVSAEPEGSSEPEASKEPEDTEEPEESGESETDESEPSESETVVSAGTGNSTSATLPQTGQLYWPIPLLAGCGLLLCIIGLILKNTERKEIPL